MKSSFLRVAFDYRTILLIVVLAVLLITSVRGIDFGHHWDEGLRMERVQKSINEGLFLPRFYGYPSLDYDLGLLARSSVFLQGMFPRLARVKLLFRARFVFIVVSTLSIVATYLISLQLFDDKNTALISAALLAFSWEFAYHIRWLATDSIMMAMVSIAYMFIVLYLKKGEYRHIKWSAIFSGMAFSTKYPAGAILVPLVLSIFVRECCMNAEGFRFKYFLNKEMFKRAVWVALIFFVTFFVISPGLLLEPMKAKTDFVNIAKKYHGGHEGYTVKHWPTHLAKVGAYFALAVLSPDKIIAAILFSMSVIGAAILLARSKSMAFIFFLLPVGYYVYFTSAKVMVVRTYLLIVPFLCVLSSAGIVGAVGFLRRRNKYLGVISGGFFLLLILYNVRFSIAAANSIHNNKRNVQSGIYVRQLREYMDGNKDEKFKLSKRIADDILKYNGTLPKNIVPDDYTGDYYRVFYSSKIRLIGWEANHYDYTAATFGPREVNFNYYPTWAGYERIVVQLRSKPATAKGEGEIVSDCEGCNFEITKGVWGGLGVVDRHNTIKHWARPDAKRSCEARWTLDVPESGDYEVFARWTASGNRATDAPYKITHAGGEDTVRVDQKKNGGEWNSLGVYGFSKESPAIITLTNEANGHVIADAVKLAPR